MTEPKFKGIFWGYIPDVRPCGLVYNSAVMMNSALVKCFASKKHITNEN